MAAFTSFPATSERAAGISRDALVSRLSNQNLETLNEYHIPLPGFNPA